MEISKQKYKYKGNTYYIENKTAFKHPESRKWVDAIIYVSESTGDRWVREAQEFFKLFEKVK